MKKILLLLFTVFFLSFSAGVVHADENFSTDYKISYNIAQNGLAHVTFAVTLTNKTANYYASYYKIQLGVTDIRNAKATDGQGEIKPDITKEASGTTVGIPFNQRVIGLNKKNAFSLSFDTSGIAQNLGKILEVNIPGLSNQDDFSSFSVNVVTPAQLGAPAYIKPAVINATSNNLTFTKENLGKSGVYIAYGDAQIYSFDLTYHLYNNNLFKVKTEIALPPKTNYQDIQIDQIEPAPVNVRVDQDGNWLADYALSASQKLDIKVTGKAKVGLVPLPEVLPENLKKTYLKQQPFWQSENSQIKDLATQLKTPKNIYNYVVKNLSYDYSRVTANKPRLGAQNVLSSPTSAVCLEFTDLFIALARAANIPAREVDGYAYTENSRERPLSLVKDVLHAWPQYYDQTSSSWVMVDPTWGNTTGGVDYFNTLDFDHLAFVIKGSDSSYPVPAGGYKLPGQEDKKDVSVIVDTNFDESLPVFKTDLEISKSVFPWAPVFGKIIIKNEGGRISDAQIIRVKTNVLQPNLQEIKIGQIPPYGNITIPLKFTTPSLLTNSLDKVTITIGQKDINAQVLISPFSFSKIQFLAIGGILIVVFTIFISIIATKSWHLHLLRPKQ